MSDRHNKLLFDAIGYNSLEMTKKSLCGQDTTDHLLLTYERKGGHVGSYLSFCVKAEAWIVFDYLISLPCIKHMTPEVFYKEHAIWLFHARSDRAIETVFLLEKSPLNIEMFYNYLFDAEVFQRASANLVTVLSKLGYPSHEWHKHKSHALLTLVFIISNMVTR
jgi:hypothetical protein